MCGRFALKAPPSKLISRFALDECAEFSPRYSIPPGTDIPVIRQSPEGKRVLHLLRWGLIPHWSKDPSIGAKLNNARGETVAEKPSFREAFKRRRCLIPADGFYEWKTEGKFKQPYYFSLKSEEPMALAGLWEMWKTPDGNTLRTVCIVTTSANELMAPVHDRMPVLISPENFGPWLNPAIEGSAVQDWLMPASPECMDSWPVSKEVSWASNEGEGLIQRIEVV